MTIDFAIIAKYIKIMALDIAKTVRIHILSDIFFFITIFLFLLFTEELNVLPMRL